VNTEKEYLEEGRRSATLGRGERLVPARVTIPVEEKIGDDIIDAVFAKLDPVALGAAVGIVSGFGLMLATAILLLKDGNDVGQTLALLSNYLPGYEVTWSGAWLGGAEAGTIGFIVGYSGAWLRNQAVQLYAMFLRWQNDSDARRRLLD
jgi:hypothetical protein